MNTNRIVRLLTVNYKKQAIDMDICKDKNQIVIKHPEYTCIITITNFGQLKYTNIPNTNNQEIEAYVEFGSMEYNILALDLEYNIACTIIDHLDNIQLLGY